jgi:hypothetical protein
MKANHSSRRHALISCPIFQREIDDCLARIDCPPDVVYLPLGLHGDAGEVALAAIQAAVDEVDPEGFDAFLIGSGVCNSGIRGLVARALPLVIPRVHDCISLLFGCRRRYAAFFESQPDSYFFTSGWIDSAEADGLSITTNMVSSQLGLDYELSALIEKYGEDNGRYIYDQLKPRQYGQHVYVSSGCREESALIEQARQNAEQKGCPLQVVEGNVEILETLLCGPWDDDRFLVVPAGKQVTVTYDDRLIDWKECDD